MKTVLMKSPLQTDRGFPLKKWAALLVIFIAFFPQVARADLIPPGRLVDWTPGLRTGVIGGIPTDRTTLRDVTKPPFNADNTGATDAKPAIQAAIDAAGAGEVVYLPAGTYRIDSTLILGTSFSGKILRGAGPGLTFIDSRANEGLKIGSASGIAPPDVTPIFVTAGLTKDSNTVTVNGDTSTLNLGQIIFFDVQSDARVPVVSVYNYDVFTNEAPTNQAVRLLSKDATHLTFFPPLFDSYGGGSLEIRVLRCTFQAVNIGIEDLTVDASSRIGGAYSCVQFNSCFGSWIRNCSILHAKNYPLAITYSLNCEVRHCTIRGPLNTGSNGAGLLFGGHSCLVEDNIILDSFPIIEVNGGSAGNVFAYNYGPPNGMWDTNHAPHNQFNLYEGNALGYQMSDGYFGSEANLTLFRNFAHGGAGINLKRFTRNVSLIGNNLSGAPNCGLPNIGNNSSDGTAQLSTGSPWRDWQLSGTLTGRTDDSTGEITLASGALFGGNQQVIRLVWGMEKNQWRFAYVGSVSGNIATIVNYHGGTALPSTGTIISIGPGAFSAYPVGSYQEKDLDVEATLIRKGNRYRNDDTFDSLGGDTLPASLFRSSKPAYFGSLAWPPVDTINPRTPSVEDIPAGYRYINGTDPGGGLGDTTAPTAPLSLAAVPKGSNQVDLSWIASTDDVGVTAYLLDRAQGTGATNYVQVGLVTGINYVDTGLTGTTVYNYRVWAVDAAGNRSVSSSVVTVSTGAVRTINKVTGLKVTEILPKP